MMLCKALTRCMVLVLGWRLGVRPVPDFVLGHMLLGRLAGCDNEVLGSRKGCYAWYFGECWQGAIRLSEDKAQKGFVEHDTVDIGNIYDKVISRADAKGLSQLRSSTHKLEQGRHRD